LDGFIKIARVAPIRINVRVKGGHVLKRMQHEKERRNEKGTILEFLESYNCGMVNTISR